MNQRELRRRLVERFPRERRYLLPALHYIHDEFGHLPEQALQTAAWHLRVPASEVYGSATSYTELRVEAPAEHTVRVCTGLSCLLNGARSVLEAAREAAAGLDTTAVEERACAFLCAAAPVVEVDHESRGRASAESIRAAVTATAGTAS